MTRIGNHLKMTLLFTLCALAICTCRTTAGNAQTLSPQQQLARDIYKELIEINTTDSVGSTTVAAQAMAKRLKGGGFSAAVVRVQRMRRRRISYSNSDRP